MPIATAVLASTIYEIGATLQTKSRTCEVASDEAGHPAAKFCSNNRRIIESKIGVVSHVIADRAVF